jgi:hypothetical protein
MILPSQAKPASLRKSPKPPPGRNVKNAFAHHFQNIISSEVTYLITEIVYVPSKHEQIKD